MYTSQSSRARYHREYYLKNKMRKKYTYIKIGVMKKLSNTQFEIVQLMRSGVVVYQYLESYRYWKGKRTVELNRRSVEALLRSKHIAVDKGVLSLTEKGKNHIQSVPKCQTKPD